MMDFSVSKSLIKLRDKKYDSKISKTINLLLENYSEDQLRFLLQNKGLLLDNNIIKLFYIDNVGFRCLNEKSELYGKLPVCKNVEFFMNKLYLENFKT
jgi:hypothetical protein